MVLHHVGHRVDAAVHRAGGAKVHLSGANIVLHRLSDAADQLIHAFVAGGGDGHHRHAQTLRQGLDIHAAAVACQLIHEVQSQHRGYAQLQQLQGEVEIALDVGGVHDVDDAVGVTVHQKIVGNHLFTGIRAQRIDAGQIHHLAVLLAPHLAHLLVHRDAGKIAHVLIGPGELVEQGGLAAVLITDQRQDHALPPLPRR